MPATLRRSALRKVRSSSPPGPRAVHKCPKCTKSFSRVENLHRHKATHSAIARFACPTCHKPFTRSDLLKRHTKLHNITDAASHTPRGTSLGNPVERAPVSSPLSRDPEQPHGILERGRYARLVAAENAIIHASQQEARTQNQHQQTISGGTSPTQSKDSSLESLTVYGTFSMGPDDGLFDTDLAWLLDFAPLSTEEYDMAQESADFRMSTTPPLQIPLQSHAPDLQGVSRQHDNGLGTSLENGSGAISHDAIQSTGEAGASDVGIAKDGPNIARDEISSFQQTNPQALVNGSGKFDHELRDSLVNALQNPLLASFMLPPLDDQAIPSIEVLNYFLELYFFYEHAKFPVMHIPTFVPNSAHPLLLIAMVLAGSCWSPSTGEAWTTTILQRARILFMQKYTVDPDLLHDIDYIFALLLLSTTSLWNGHKSSYEFAEVARGMLVAANRRCRLLDRRLLGYPETEQAKRHKRDQLQQAWVRWVEAEKRKRLGLSIYLFDSQFTAIFNNQPYVNKAETINAILPCSALYWEAPTAEDWKVLLGPAVIPASTYLLIALDTCLMYPALGRDPPYAPLDDFGKTLVIYALFTHIYEWRQTVNMLEHTGFSRGSNIPGLSEPLIQRKQWLRNAIASWCKHYQDSPRNLPTTGSSYYPDLATFPPLHSASIATSLLIHLAHISLDTIVPQVHVLASNNASQEEQDLAIEYFQTWCAQPISAVVMARVRAMLALSHLAIEQHAIKQCNHELAVSLLTGGLICWVYHNLRPEVPQQHQQQEEEVEEHTQSGRVFTVAATTTAATPSPSAPNDTPDNYDSEDLPRGIYLALVLESSEALERQLTSLKICANFGRMLKQLSKRKIERI